MDPLKIGIIGCGENAKKALVKAILQTDLAQVVATMDVKLGLARDLAEEAGATSWTDDLDEIVNDDAVEAVIISTPHHLHVPQGIAAARQHKHVLMDKPLSTNVEDAQKLIAACKEQSVQLGVLFGQRMSNIYFAAADLLDKGALGKITGLSVVRMWRKANSYWSGGYTGRVQTGWRTKKATSGGGMLMINYSHNLDRLQNLLGLKLESVYAQYDTFNTPVEVEDYFSVIVRYKGGAIGTYLGSSATPGGFRTPDRIYGTEGTLEWGTPLRVFTTCKVEGLTPDEWNEIPLERESANDSYRRVIDNFARAVRGEEELVITGDNALPSLQVVEAAFRSQEIGGPVVFDEV